MTIVDSWAVGRCRDWSVEIASTVHVVHYDLQACSGQSMKSLNAFTMSARNIPATYTHTTFQANRTQLTCLREACILKVQHRPSIFLFRYLISCLQAHYSCCRPCQPRLLNLSSSFPTQRSSSLLALSQQARFRSHKITSSLRFSSRKMLLQKLGQQSSNTHPFRMINSFFNPNLRPPLPYAVGGAPAPSVLCPHCLARHRLCLWIPAPLSPLLSHSSRSLPYHSTMLIEIQNSIANSWNESTQSTYGSGLLAYHVHCDKFGIPDEGRAPCSHDLLAAFITSLTGLYSGKTISNYVAGVRAWHILHHISWLPDSNEVNCLLASADKKTPESSKKLPRQPFTVAYITTLRFHFIRKKPSNYVELCRTMQLLYFK